MLAYSNLKRKILDCFCGLTSILLMVFVGASFMSTMVIKQDVFSQKLSDFSEESDFKYAYSTLAFTNAPSSKDAMSKASDLIMNTRINNDDCYKYIYSSDEQGNPKTVLQTSKNGAVKEIVPVSFPENSNGATFQLLNVSLYKNFGKEIERAPKGDFEAGAVVYIPDYMADDIIDASNGTYSTYDDLFNSNYFFSYNDNLGNKLKLRVCNVFFSKGFIHGDGYDENTNLTGMDISESMRLFLGDFVVMLAKDYFQNNGHSSRVGLGTAGTISNMLNFLNKTYGSYSEDYFLSSPYFIYRNGEIVYNHSFDVLNSLFYSGVSSLNGINWLFCFFSLFFALLLSTLSFFLYRSPHSFLDNLIIFSFPFLFQLLVELIGNIGVSLATIGYLSLFNIPYGITYVIICVVFFLAPILLEFVKNRKEKKA